MAFSGILSITFGRLAHRDFFHEDVNATVQPATSSAVDAIDFSIEQEKSTRSGPRSSIAESERTG